MKKATCQHTLAAIGFAAWLLFAVAGIASPAQAQAQAHEYTYGTAWMPIPPLPYFVKEEDSK